MEEVTIPQRDGPRSTHTHADRVDVDRWNIGAANSPRIEKLIDRKFPLLP